MNRIILFVLFMAAACLAKAPVTWAVEQFSGDVSAGYGWGNYSSPGELDDAHAGMRLDLCAGIRFQSGLEIGAIGIFGFPQIRVMESLEDAAFSSMSYGMRAGYLWRQKLEPYLEYCPYARLTQSVTTRAGGENTETELSYRGHAFGGGLKAYLSQRESGGVHVGLGFAYTREHYGRMNVSSTRGSATKDLRTGDGNVTGNAYVLSLFIGI